MIKDDMQQTFNTGVQLGISIHERKIVYASEHNKPIEKVISSILERLWIE